MMNTLYAFLVVAACIVPRQAYAYPDCSGLLLVPDDTTVAAFDVPPRPLTQAPVTYPDAAKKDRIEGTVMVMVTIEANGSVSNVAVKKGVRKDVDDAAMTSARQWTFEPAQREGKKVTSVVAIPFRFKLDETKDGTEGRAEGSDAGVPKLVTRVDPSYPEQAVEAKVEGTVFVEMTIDAEGNVTDARIIKGGHELLNDAALSSVRKWKFEASGKHASTVVAPIRFKLSAEKQ